MNKNIESEAILWSTKGQRSTSQVHKVQNGDLDAGVSYRVDSSSLT